MTGSDVLQSQSNLQLQHTCSCSSSKASRLHGDCCCCQIQARASLVQAVPPERASMPPSILHACVPGRGFPWPYLPAGHHYNRIAVVTIGCLLWGVMTALFSVTQSLQQVRLVTATLIC